ncbi:MAG: trigger factor [Gammaproteobacteria bacterium]|nr:trigger factor [Gammaproteobacteria bacterium]
MMVTVESVSNLERRMKVQVPAAKIEDQVDSRLRSVGKSAKLKGFRPGKVPMNVLRQHYGPQVRQEVLSEVIQSTYSEAIGKENLRPAGGPKIEASKVIQGEDLEYTATFEVYPEISIGGLDKIKVERPSADVEESDVDDMIEKLRRQKASWEVVERAAQAPDRVVIDFEGRVDGEVFDGGVAKEAPVELGAGKMLPDFEAGLEGICADDEREIKVCFPDDYQASELAGKDAVFTVKAHKVEAQKLPELDAEFCKAFGVDEGGIDTLRKEVRANMQRELGEAVRGKVKAQLMEGLLEQNKIDLPKALVDEEIDKMQQEMFGGKIPDEKRAELPRQPFEEQAGKRVALGLLLGEIVRTEQLEVDQERLREKVGELASTYDDPDKVARAYMSNPSLLAQIENMVLEEQAVSYLLGKAKVKDKSVKFKDVMDAG